MPAGRPKQIEGACLINCTIPVKLRDFLKEHNINRSELFRKAALKMYEHQICPKCYSDDIIDEYKGKICNNCKKWLVQKTCPDCNVPWTPDRNGTQVITDGEEKIICSSCFNKHHQQINDWYTEELSRSKDDKK